MSGDSLSRSWGWSEARLSRGVAEGLGGANFGGELLLLFAQRAEVALHLQAVPELGRLAEKRSEADGHDGGDGAVPKDDLVDRAGRNADGAGHGILGNPHRSEVFLQQNFTGCDGRVHGYNA